MAVKDYCPTWRVTWRHNPDDSAQKRSLQDEHERLLLPEIKHSRPALVGPVCPALPDYDDLPQPSCASPDPRRAAHEVYSRRKVAHIVQTGAQVSDLAAVDVEQENQGLSRCGLSRFSATEHS